MPDSPIDEVPKLGLHVVRNGGIGPANQGAVVKASHMLEEQARIKGGGFDAGFGKPPTCPVQKRG